MYHAYVVQISVFLCIVQTITHNESIGDGEAYIIHRHFCHTTVGFVQQCAEFQFLRISLDQQCAQFAQCSAAVDDVFYQQYVFACDVFIQVAQDFDMTAAFCTVAVAGSVSYTHLDVYKRQDMPAAVLPWLHSFP